MTESTVSTVHYYRLIVYLHGCRIKGGVSVAECLLLSVLDSGAVGPGFKSQPPRCRVTVLGKLFTPVASVYQAAKLLLKYLMEITVLAESCFGLDET